MHLVFCILKVKSQMVAEAEARRKKVHDKSELCIMNLMIDFVNT